MVKIRKNILYYVLAVVLATAFFAHETFKTDYADLNNATQVWESHKQKRTDALNIIKDEAKGTEVYQTYLFEKERTDEAYDVLLAEYDKLKFLEFKSFQQFMGEFGWAIGLFIYSFFNLFISYTKKSQFIHGEILLHTTLVFISLFFIRWCFKSQDFMELEYILTNLICAVSLSMAAYFLIKVKDRYADKLKAIIRKLFDYIILDSEEYIDQEKINDYKVNNVELISQISEEL